MTINRMSLLQHRNSDFVRSWRPPASEFESKIEAVASLTALTSVQVQFIADFWQHSNNQTIEKIDLLDECEKYTRQQLNFLDNLETSSLPGNSQGAQASGASQEPLPSTSNTPSVAPPAEDPQDSGEDFTDGLTAAAAASSQDSVDGANLSCVASSSGQNSPSVKNVENTRDSAFNSINSNLESEIVPDSEVEPQSNPQRMPENGAQAVPNLERLKISRMSAREKEIYFVENSLIALQKEHELLDKNRKCTECKESIRDVTFLPCGHFLMCKNCSEPVYECPLCTKEVIATAQTYLS